MADASAAGSRSWVSFKDITCHEIWQLDALSMCFAMLFWELLASPKSALSCMQQTLRSRFTNATVFYTVCKKSARPLTLSSNALLAVP